MSILKMGHHTDMEFFKCFARARFPFLAIQDSSIPDIVGPLVPWSEPTNNQRLGSIKE